MQHHVRKDIAIDAKVTLTSPTFIPATFTSLLRLTIFLVPLRAIDLAVLFSLSPLSITTRWTAKRNQTAHTLRATLLAGARPGYRGPVAERKEVVVRPREMGGEEESKLA